MCTICLRTEEVCLLLVPSFRCNLHETNKSKQSAVLSSQRNFCYEKVYRQRNTLSVYKEEAHYTNSVLMPVFDQAFHPLINSWNTRKWRQKNNKRWQHMVAWWSSSSWYSSNGAVLYMKITDTAYQCPGAVYIYFTLILWWEQSYNSHFANKSFHDIQTTTVFCGVLLEKQFQTYV